jgi:hypothetical protein
MISSRLRPGVSRYVLSYGVFGLTEQAGHDFDHDCALRWAAIELYAEVCFYVGAFDWMTVS